MANAENFLPIEQIQPRVLKVVYEQLGIERDRLSLQTRLIEDLHCDSLEVVELVLELEDEFGVSLPDRPTDPTYKAVFTREGFCLGDLAEAVTVPGTLATAE